MTPAEYVKNLIARYDSEVSQAEASVEELRLRIHNTRAALARELHEFVCQLKVDDRISVHPNASRVYVLFRDKEVASVSFSENINSGVTITIGSPKLNNFIFPPYGKDSTITHYLADKEIAKALSDLKRELLSEFDRRLTNYKEKVISEV